LYIFATNTCLDVCSDALLSAHESEITRLEALKEQRLPMLEKINRHRELINERDELQASSQDATRLMSRGQKGERRDPGKLLREEKMRKRISKELPKVEAELKKTLERWEDEYGRPFLILGERYLDNLYSSASTTLPPRSKTPSVASQPARQPPKSAPPSRPGTVRGSMQPPSRAKTPVANFGASVSRNAFASSMMSTASAIKSPSKIPSRSALNPLPHGGNSPERRPTMERQDSTLRKMPPPRAPPPKMKDLFVPPPMETATPANHHQINRDRSDSIVRQVPPEDPYDDRTYMSQSVRAGYTPQYAPPIPGSRQISDSSSTGTGHTMQSGSENWETFSERSEEPERDIDFHYYRQQSARNKRFTPEGGHAASPRGIQGKKIRSVRGVGGDYQMENQGGQMVRVVDGSEAGWTDEDAY
jgi:protein regulator of cytokinesis 1